MASHPPRLSDAEKRQLFHDGFVIIRNCIPRHITEPAKECIYGNLDNKGFRNNRDPRTLALYKDSPLAAIVEEVIGLRCAILLAVLVGPFAACVVI